MCFLKEQKHLIYQQYGSISMKEFVRYASRSWHDLKDDTRIPYQMMGEVEKVRYERDKQAFMTGGMEGPLDLQLKQAQINLAQQLKSYQPQILVDNINAMRSEGKV
jgi:hypothetical protein